jgi:hypothetical protein
MIGRDVVVEAEVVKQSSRFAASPESHETVNHGPPFTSINRTLFQQYRRILSVEPLPASPPKAAFVLASLNCRAERRSEWGGSGGKVQSSDEIAQVGTISANGDKAIGKIIADATKKVGNG